MCNANPTMRLCESKGPGCLAVRNVLWEVSVHAEVRVGGGGGRVDISFFSFLVRTGLCPESQKNGQKNYHVSGCAVSS